MAHHDDTSSPSFWSDHQAPSIPKTRSLRCGRGWNPGKLPWPIHTWTNSLVFSFRGSSLKRRVASCRATIHGFPRFVCLPKMIDWKEQVQKCTVFCFLCLYISYNSGAKEAINLSPLVFQSSHLFNGQWSLGTWQVCIFSCSVSPPTSLFESSRYISSTFLFNILWNLLWNQNKKKRHQSMGPRSVLGTLPI